jgi:DNA (cytosine-5)-methyltransferase 1
MNGLILSLFPGLDLLGMAFEAAGWCVVRGPDVLWAGDVRGWHVPAGRFNGIIGGPPCQMFSPLANLVRHNGNRIKFGNLVPEFERVVDESLCEWWLMEEVTGAPIPHVVGYEEESIILSPRDLGDAQSRDRRITVGALRYRPIGLTGRLPALAGSQEPPVPAATGSGTKWERRPGRLSRPGPAGSQSWAVAKQLAEVQGYPGLDEALRETNLWTAQGVCKALGNGVPRVMGVALARAITEWWGERA